MSMTAVSANCQKCGRPLGTTSTLMSSGGVYHPECAPDLLNRLDAMGKELTAERTIRQAAEAKVGDLTAERDEARNHLMWAHGDKWAELVGMHEDRKRALAAEAKVVEALLPEPAYWIVTWPGKSQGVHAAYGDIEEAKHAAKNIANYSTKKTETTIVPLYTVPASDLWKDRYESLLADAQRMEASIGARDE